MALRKFELRWAETIGRTLVPRGALGGVVDDVSIAEGVREDYAASPWFVRLFLRAALWLAWFAPTFTLRRARTLGGCDEAARIDALERLLAHRSYNVRLAGMFVKLTVCAILLGDRRALTRLNAYGLARPLKLARLEARSAP